MPTGKLYRSTSDRILGGVRVVTACRDSDRESEHDHELPGTRAEHGGLLVRETSKGLGETAL